MRIDIVTVLQVADAGAWAEGFCASEARKGSSVCDEEKTAAFTAEGGAVLGMLRSVDKQALEAYSASAEFAQEASDLGVQEESAGVHLFTELALPGEGVADVLVVVTVAGVVCCDEAA